jgi:hypothetical protein
MLLKNFHLVYYNWILNINRDSFVHDNGYSNGLFYLYIGLIKSWYVLLYFQKFFMNTYRNLFNVILIPYSLQRYTFLCSYNYALYNFISFILTYKNYYEITVKSYYNRVYRNVYSFDMPRSGNFQFDNPLLRLDNFSEVTPDQRTFSNSYST